LDEDIFTKLGGQMHHDQRWSQVLQRHCHVVLCHGSNNITQRALRLSVYVRLVLLVLDNFFIEVT